MEFSDTKGRHAVANATIEPGEVICKFKPVASMILFGDSMDFCHNCLDHVISHQGMWMIALCLLWT